MKQNQRRVVPHVPKAESVVSFARTVARTSFYVAADDDDDLAGSMNCPPIPVARRSTVGREVARDLPGAAGAPHLSILS